MAQDSIAKYRAVVIAGSAGSLEIVLQIISMLPEKSGAVFIIVLHRKNDPDSILTDLLSTRTDLIVKEAEDKEPLVLNNVCIAPPDYHLLLEDENTFSLDSSEKINYCRPSIDVTFESVANVFGEAAIGILLSGANADGAAGLKKMKEAGGHTIVQNPNTAEVYFMPREALKICSGHQVAEAADISGILLNLLGRA